jgi:ring-1,2-phenylacetyl-CoA epoxidase subunit PaaC
MKNHNLYQYCLQLGDTSFILSHRIAEYCSKAPHLEEDLAITNVGLDLLGQAESLLKYAAEIKGDGTTEDDLVFKRKEKDFRSIHLTEIPNFDFAFILARQFLMDVYNNLLFSKLSESEDAIINGISKKSIKEIRYHFQRSENWMIRLGQGTEESNQRIQHALDDLWMYTNELFYNSSAEIELEKEGIAVLSSSLENEWRKKTNEVIVEAGLVVPENQPHSMQYGKDGIHTEYLGFLLAEMQHLPLLYPDAKW